MFTSIKNYYNVSGLITKYIFDMIIEYTKALFNKIIKLIDVIQGVKKTKEEPLRLPQSVATHFPKDEKKIFRLITKLLNKVAFEEDGYNSCNTSFQSKHNNGFITIKLITYKTQEPSGLTTIHTQIQIANDKGQVVEYIS